MCSTQTLAYSSEGYIIRCSDCGRMQLAFGVVALVIKRNQLIRLKEHAALELSCGHDSPGMSGHKCFSIPVDERTVLCLTREELHGLANLLDQAFALLEVYEWLTV